MPTYEITQYLVFLLFLPLSIFSILKGKFYIATVAILVACVDMLLIGLRLAGIA